MPAFNSLRKKLRRRRIETMLLAGYAFAITCALLLSLINKSVSDKPKLPIYHNTEENYDLGSDILIPAFNDSAQDNPFEVVYMQVNDIKLLSDNDVISRRLESVQTDKNIVMPVTAKPKYVKDYGEISGIYQKERRVLVVKSGDTFIGMLTKLGMDNKNATEAYNVFRKVFDARNLKIGQYIELTATFDIQSRQLEALDTLIIQPERGSKYILRMNEYDKYEAKAVHEKFAKDVKVVNGKVSGSVSASLVNAGVPQRLAGEIINRMSHQINFRTDISKGDSFSVKYEVSKASNGDVVKIGALLFASFNIKNRLYKIYRFKDNFYDERGQAKKTGLDIKPLAMRNARISSLFGYRRHPIYKTTKFHSGVDYAAPRGTAIYASGNGTVEMARYVNGYGNFVKIRHNSEYETAYGHMQRFASGIRPGIRVKKGQVIGYVGSTGRSTGPHLHFEILRHGQRINPLKAKVATGNDLYGGQLAEFKRRVKQIDASSEQIGKTPETKKEEKVLGHTAEILAGKMQEQQDNDAENGQAVPSEQTDGEKVIASAENQSQPEPIVEKENIRQENKNTAASENVEPKEPTENKNQETEQISNEKDEKNEKVEAEQLTYKGKIIYPPKQSSGKLRQNKLSVNSKTSSKIRVPAKKPKYARK
ncbi:MAG: peptidoglycan DD-metalloendopeptidase family protein [Alphaproteobacteria bacterium]|nr:peptidoglycan DD-metalloendopeptidase family protein [Alphaproteobacteria bacterium]